MPPASIERAGRLYAAGDRDGAARECEAILDAEPSHFDALHLLGVLRNDAKRHADAAELLGRARGLAPGNGAVLKNLGIAMAGAKRHAEALDAFRAAAAAGIPGCDGPLAETLHALERYGEAADAARAASAADPDSGYALYQLARALERAGRPCEAVAPAREALARAPDANEAVAAVMLATALRACARYGEALDVLRALLARRPGVPEAEWYASLLLLQHGEMEEGWRLYETRWQDDNRADSAPPGHEVLDLATVAGKTVLVHAEQGFGDNIQFARYMPMLAARGARVLARTTPELLAVIRGMVGVESAVAWDAPIPAHDLSTALLSLPLAFGTTMATIPSECGYLAVPDERRAAWRARLGPRTRPRVGLAWAGTRVNPLRSLPRADMLAPLLDGVDAEFHSLHRDERAGDEAWLAADGRIVRHPGATVDFADTAALILEMDAVATIDTSTAHLAGAFDADWRWLLDRPDSPWYPSATLYRQSAPAAWDQVLARVADDLTALLGAA